jgi:hypothetical protein
MAKVRLQARPSDESDIRSVEEGTHGNGTTLADAGKGRRPPSSLKPRYTGAIDVLRKVLQESGPKGWYQVS